jgi:KUP system potassium uptake protein
MQEDAKQGNILPLTVAALGVVFGDIGTSPLYAFRECMAHGSTRPEVFGVLSLILWSLILIVSVKYVSLILRADNKGEGGILALLAFAFPPKITPGSCRTAATMTALGLFGAALLYGDGMITPAISVLSAVEGLELVAPSLEVAVVPLTLVILVGLFAVQKKGTGTVGKIFGVVMLLWFSVIGFLGLISVARHPGILAAFNPLKGVSYLAGHGKTALVVLGSVFLAVTGGEALYADMGHFGRRPIRLAWNFFVLPALALNYLGQGAAVLENGAVAENPFYLMAPGWMLLPMVILATGATIIASQALISGAFSLTMQAVQMGYLPRIRVLHTSKQTSGQIYIPQVCLGLAVSCLLLVLAFRSSSALAAAYGVAVTLTMLATTILFYFAARRIWGWSRLLAVPVCGVFVLIELAFFASNVLKIGSGGWLPLIIGSVIFAGLTTWKKGRELISKQMSNTLPLGSFIESIGLSGTLDEKLRPHRVKGTAVFLASSPDRTPAPLLANLKYNHVLHERIIILNIVTDRTPTVDRAQRIQIQPLPDEFYGMTAHFGFMELATIEEIIQSAALGGFIIDAKKATFFLGRETLLATKKKSLSRWRKAIFIMMSRNAENAAEFFRLPSDRTVEIGRQVEL